MTMSEGFLKNFDLVLIITEDPSNLIRGYSILGREFRIKNTNPVEDEVLSLDGAKFAAAGYLIDTHEYLRVVPEASKQEYRGPFVMIPTWAARVSFKPKSLS